MSKTSEIHGRGRWPRRASSLLGAMLLFACKAPEPMTGLASSPTAPAPTLIGHVQAHGGSALKAARMSVSRVSYREPELSLSLDPDGYFDASLPGAGVYVVEFVDIDHTPLRRAFAVDSGVVEIRARLGTSESEGTLELRGEGVVSSRDAEAWALVDELRKRAEQASIEADEGDGCEVVLAAAADVRAGLDAIDDDRELKAFAALAWAQMLGREGCLAPGDLDWVLDAAPVEHIAWAFQGIRVQDVFAGMLHDPLARRVRLQLAQAQTEPGLRAHLLYLDILDFDRSGDAARVGETYAALIRDYAGSTSAQLAREAYDPARPLQVGRTMPDWQFIGLDGEPLRATDFRGQPYLLEIWATWCGPCIDEMESVHATWDALGRERGPVRFVWVSIDTDLEQIHSFRREQWPMPWILAHEPDAQALFDAWWFGGVPMAVLVDPEGRIAATSDELRGEALRSTLLELTK